MYKLTGNPKTLRVTRALAKQFMEMEACPGDRPLSERRLMVYERVVHQGGFRPCQWAAAFCEQTGATYRVNGKHTSTLFSKLDPLPELYATVEYYSCETLAEVAELYATYDSKMMSRTVSDINRSFARTVPQLDGIDERTINLTVSASAFHAFQEQYRNRMQPAERAELLLENYDFAVWVYELLGGQRTDTHLKRVAVFAAMLDSYRVKKGQATEFWTLVRDETAPKPSDPTRVLARFLLLNSAKNGANAGTRGRKIPDREFYVRCIHAWNAWKSGDNTRLNYFINAPIPEFS